MEKKLSKYDIFAVVSIIFILIHIVNIDSFSINSDFYFLYNRAKQMLDCIMDGNIPFFYYNDFNGVGYGSAFFYGHLTLYPFLPFVLLGEDIFIKMYVLVVLILTYLGVSYFSKRFTNNYKLVGVLYMCSVFTLQLYIITGMYANLLGTALGFFFLAKCVDFFRGNKSFVPCSILFYIIFNTHLISSVLCFICSVVSCILYFDKKRIKEYLKFTLLTVALCSYNILNMLYHFKNLDFNVLTFTQDSISSNGLFMFYSNFIPFGGIPFSMLFNSISNNGFRQLNFFILGVCLFLLIKRRKSVTRKEKIALTLYVLLTVISIQQVWFLVFSDINNLIQFSFRYMPYLLVVFLIICFRKVDSKILVTLCLLFCLPELLLASVSISSEGSKVYTDLESQVVNGEYLDSSFNWDIDEFLDLSSSVKDLDGNNYSFTKVKNKTYVTLPVNKTNDIVLTLPKLYYNGYKFYSLNDGNTQSFKVAKGYSQFISVTIPKSNKDSYFVLEYVHPYRLIILDTVCIICVVLLGGYYVFKIRPRYELG